MGNCLVTKLNGTVNNPDLIVLNEIGITFVPSQSGNNGTINNNTYSRFVLKGETTLELVGNGYFEEASTGINKGKKVVLNAYDANVKGVVIMSDDASELTLKINPYYNVVTKIGADNTAGFPGLPNISMIKGVESIKYADFSKVLMTNYTFEDFVISDFITNTTGRIEISNGPISENIKAIGNHPNLRNINFSNSPNLYGTVESIVEGLYANNFENGASIETRFNNDANVYLKNVKGTTSIPYGGVFTISRSGSVFSIIKNGDTVATYDGTTWRDENNNPYVPIVII